MNLRELIVLTYKLNRQLGSYEGIPATEDTVRLLNQALRFIGRKLHVYDPAIRFSITEGQGIYNLDSSAFGKVVTKLDKVVVNGAQLQQAGSRSGLWSVAELDKYCPTWRTDSTLAAPKVAVDYGSNKLLIYPLPDEDTEEATNHFVSGWVLPGVYASNGTYANGFGLIDKAELPAGYGGPIPGGGPQPPFVGAGGGMGGTIIPPGVTVAPPVSGGTTGGGFTGGSTSGGGGPRLEEAVDIWDLPTGDGGGDEGGGGPLPLAIPSGPGQGGSSELVWDLWAEPDIVVDLHELLAYYAALKMAEPMAADDVMWTKLRGIRSDLTSLITEVSNGYESRQMPWGNSAGGGQNLSKWVRF